MTFTHHHRVRSYEVDHQGIVFNGRYLEISDAAMTDFFGQLGHSYPEMVELGFDPAIVAIDVRFSSPARLGDDITVTVVGTRLGNSSFDLRFRFARGDDLFATITTTYVNVTRGVSSSAAVTGRFRELVASTIDPAGELT